MAYSVQMPALGESVTEGTVTRWLKQDGDTVEVDEPLLEVSTDKVDTEIPSPVAGVLEKIIAAEDETVEVGAELAVIGDGADEARRLPVASPGLRRIRPSPSDASRRPSRSRSPQPQAAGRAAERRRSRAPARRRTRRPAAGGKGTPVTLPALGESVTEGTVTRWLKQVGDTVEVDEPLLEVSTDKVDTEVPSPVAGTLLEITAGEDETVEVGGQLGVIGDAGAAPDSGDTSDSSRSGARAAAGAGRAEARAAAGAARAGAAEAGGPEAAGRPSSSRPPKQEAPSTRPQPSNDGTDGAPYVTPLVRKLAAEHGVDLATVNGSGVGGRIRKQDVLAAAEAKRRPPPQQAPAAQRQQQAPSRPSAPAPQPSAGCRDSCAAPRRR